jgi:hypothetical protein
MDETPRRYVERTGVRRVRVPNSTTTVYVPYTYGYFEDAPSPESTPEHPRRRSSRSR